MAANTSINNAKPIHEVMKVVRGMLQLQCSGRDVAIPYLQGPPGIAKTASVIDICVKQNWNLLITHYGMKPIEEVSGIPRFQELNITDDRYSVITGGKMMEGTIWSLPDVLTDLYLENAKNPDTLTIWFQDDMHTASPALYNLGYEMYTERKLRGRKIPDNVAFLLAGNTGSKAGAQTLFSAIANRVALLPTTMDFNYWKENYAIPHGVNNKVVSFLSHATSVNYRQEEEKINEAWASYRSWTRFANLLDPMEEGIKELAFDDILYYCAAHVGGEAAGRFVQHYKIFSQIDTAKIFDKQIPIKIPDDMMTMYIYIMATTSEFIGRYIDEKANSTKKNDIINTMANIIIETGKKASDIAVTAAKEVVVTENALKLNNIFINLNDRVRTLDPGISKRINHDIGLI